MSNDAITRLQEIRVEVDKLKAERDEADRRAGAAERELAYFKDSAEKRDNWLRTAKKQWGISTNVSFDVVWEQCLILKAANDKRLRRRNR